MAKGQLGSPLKVREDLRDIIRKRQKYKTVNFPSVRKGEGWVLIRVAVNEIGDEKWHILHHGRKMTVVPYESRKAAASGLVAMRR